MRNTDALLRVFLETPGHRCCSFVLMLGRHAARLRQGMPQGKYEEASTDALESAVSRASLMAPPHSRSGVPCPTSPVRHDTTNSLRQANLGIRCSHRKRLRSAGEEAKFNAHFNQIKQKQAASSPPEQNQQETHVQQQLLTGDQQQPSSH